MLVIHGYQNKRDPFLSSPCFITSVRSYSGAGIAEGAWATGWMIGGSSPGRGCEFLFTASRPAQSPTQPPSQWVPGALFLSVKRPGREADLSPPPSAEVK
jgi:hypothetical protein